MQTDGQMESQTERHDKTNSRFLKFANATRHRVHVWVNTTMKRFRVQKSSITDLPRGISCLFVEHEVSLVRLQQPTLGSYHKPVQSSPEPATKFLFSAIFTKWPRICLRKCSLLFIFSNWILRSPWFFIYPAACHLTFLNLIAFNSPGQMAVRHLLRVA